MEITRNANSREAEHPIYDIFLKRWSPRAFSEQALTEGELMSLLEAARWAPSGFNEQPWRAVYALRNSDAWNGLFNLLVDANKVWAKNAGALLLFLSRKNFTHNNKPNGTHSYDTGAAWISLAFQAELMGLAAHGMAGFDHERARTELSIPDDFQVEAMAAVGHRGDPKNLPPEIAAREKPSGRKSLRELVFEGRFRSNT